MLPRLAATGVSLALALAASGCSGDDEPGARPSTPVPTADAGPPLEVGKRLWGTRETGLQQVTAFEPRGELTFVSGYGQYSQSDNHVLGVETRTGEVLWRRTFGDRVPGAGGAVLWNDAIGVGDDPRLPVAVTLYRSRVTSPELTIGLLDPGTGRLEQMSDATVRSTADGGADPYLTVVDASGDVAVADVTYYGDDPPPARTVAIDLSDGRVLWQRRGLVAASVQGDRVLVTDRYVVDEPTAGTWQALDLDTGETRWRREDFGTELVAGLADGLVLFSPVDPSVASDPGTGTDVVDVDTGEVVLEAAGDAVASSATDDFGSRRAPGEFVAWLDEDERLVTYAAGDDEPVTGHDRVAGPLFDVVGDQVTHVGSSDDGVRVQGVVDRAGAPATITDSGVLFYSDGDLVVTGRYSRSFEVSRQVS